MPRRQPGQSEPETDLDFSSMRLALRLARRGYGQTSPNPMVGAMVVKDGEIIGRGYHHRAGEPHAEILALRNAAQKGCDPAGATLYVTLEPCSTQGRTPPCTEALVAAGLKRVVAATADPNPAHAGRGFSLLERAGIAVRQGVLAGEANRLNEAFNHWIVHHRPFVIVKAAMTVDGKIATAAGESKWINSSASRRLAMRWRQGADAVLVGIGTILADNPKLTVRFCEDTPSKTAGLKRRIVLDSLARTPLDAAVVADDPHHLTTIAVTRAAPPARVAALKKRVRVLIAPVSSRRVPLNWLLRVLGQQAVTSLLVEGGGEVHASFLEQRLVNRICFFYAPKVIGGRDARKAVAGLGAAKWGRVARLGCLEWRRSGPDLLLTGLVKSAGWSQNYV